MDEDSQGTCFLPVSLMTPMRTRLKTSSMGMPGVVMFWSRYLVYMPLVPLPSEATELGAVA